MLAINAALNENKEPKHYLLKPTSKLKRTLKELTIKQWQFKWDYGDTGRETYQYFPTLDKNRLISDYLSSQQYTAYEAFSAYLHRFNKADTLHCECGSEGTPKYILLNCPLT